MSKNCNACGLNAVFGGTCTACGAKQGHSVGQTVCGDVKAGTVLVVCECGALRQHDRPHGFVSDQAGGADSNG